MPFQLSNYRSQSQIGAKHCYKYMVWEMEMKSSSIFLKYFLQLILAIWTRISRRAQNERLTVKMTQCKHCKLVSHFIPHHLDNNDPQSDKFLLNHFYSTAEIHLQHYFSRQCKLIDDGCSLIWFHKLYKYIRDNTGVLIKFEY